MRHSLLRYALLVTVPYLLAWWRYGSCGHYDDDMTADAWFRFSKSFGGKFESNATSFASRTYETQITPLVEFTSTEVVATLPPTPTSTPTASPSSEIKLVEELPGAQCAQNTTSSDGFAYPGRFWKDNYPLPEHRRQCDEAFGFGLIEVWQRARATYCRPRAPDHSAPGSSSQSALYCHRILQQGHGGYDNMCFGHNITMDYSRLEGGVAGGAEQDEYYRFPYGSISGVCEKDQSVFLNEHFQLELLPVFSAFEGREKAVEEPPASGNESSTAVVVKEPTLFVTRTDYANLYHATADFMNAFLALHVAGYGHLLRHGGPGVRVVILDAHAPCSLDSVWAPLFGRTQPVEFARDLIAARKVTRYETAIFNIPNGSCLFYKNWNSAHPCGGTGGFDLFTAFARVVLDSYGLLHTPIPDKPSVTFCWRRDYVAHPRDHGRRMDKITNENELLEKTKSSGGDIEVRGVNFAAMMFKEQLETIRQTNVLVSMHGAALTHLMFLPDEAVVVEIFSARDASFGEGRKQHYRNMARWTGKLYLPFLNNNGHPGDDDWSAVVDWARIEPVIDAAVRLARIFNLGSRPCGLQC